MTRTFYSYAIFFTALFIIASLFQSIILFTVGRRMIELPSLSGWLIVTYGIMLAWSLVTLKYYHEKHFRFTFWVLAVSTVISFFQVLLFYSAVQTGEPSIWYFFVTVVMFATGLVYALSLVFSPAGQRPWLKAAGVFTFLFEVAIASSFAWAVLSIGARLNGSAENLEVWASLIGSLVPVLFIMNFRSERKVIAKVKTSQGDSLEVVMGFAALTAVASILFFGQKITIGAVEMYANPGYVSGHLKKLAEPFEARTHVNSRGETLQYRLRYPLNYDSTKKYPLVVCLHGGSGRGDDNVKQVATSFAVRWLSTEENRTKYPAFLFVPQCPQRAGFGGIEHLPAVDSLVFETIHELEQRLPIDVTRRYVSGHSLGGTGAWHFIGTRPEMFAAAIPLAGEGDPELAPNMVDVPVWAFHGRKDRIIPVGGSQKIIDAIKNAGGNPRYTEYPEKGHHIWEDVAATPALLEWLFSQNRDE